MYPGVLKKDVIDTAFLMGRPGKMDLLVNCVGIKILYLDYESCSLDSFILINSNTYNGRLVSEKVSEKLDNPGHRKLRLLRSGIARAFSLRRRSPHSVMPCSF